MSRVIVAALAVCFLNSMGMSTCAEEPIDTKAVIAKALKAHGGEDKLRKYAAAHVKVKGKYYGMGDNDEYTGEYWLQGAKQFRSVLQGEADGEKYTEIRVVNGDKGWIVEDDEIKEMDKDVLTESKEDLYLQWVTGLTPLQDGEFKLDTVGTSKIGDKEVVGIRVIRKGHRDINLYFDAEKGLLLKAEMRVIGVEEDGKEATQETFYEDYRDADGIPYAAKITIKRDAKDYIVEEVTDYQPEKKLDEDLFAKPKMEK
jgi:hypothetical protein